jgi:hypothetical protein
MTARSERNNGLEVCLSTRDAQIGHQLKSRFSEVLNEPLPRDFLRALCAIREQASVGEPDPQSNSGDLHDSEGTGKRVVLPRSNAARVFQPAEAISARKGTTNALAISARPGKNSVE